MGNIFSNDILQSGALFIWYHNLLRGEFLFHMKSSSVGNIFSTDILQSGALFIYYKKLQSGEFYF